MRAMMLSVVASLGLASSAQAAGWADFEAAFPLYPCQDGWVACRAGGGVVDPDLASDARGMPQPADLRVGWDLQPTRVFSPFSELSAYTGRLPAKAERPAAAAAPAKGDGERVASNDGGGGTKASRPSASGGAAERDGGASSAGGGGTVGRPVAARPPDEPTGGAADDGVAEADAAPAASVEAPSSERSDGTADQAEPVAMGRPPEPEPVAVPEPEVRAIRPVELPPAPEPEPIALPEPEPVPEPEPEPEPPEADDAAAAIQLPAPVERVEAAAAEVEVDDSCDNLTALEPMAMLGKLSQGQEACLESSYGVASKQTDKDKLSRVLMTNAYASGRRGEWEQLVKRHLDEVDQSDPDLCYKYALHLSKKGPGRAWGVIRWSNLALENRTVWTGDTYKSRVNALYKLRAVAAQALWQDAEETHASAPTDESKKSVDETRNQTKVLAREWYEYAKVAGKDATTALQLCVSAAGTQDYCEGS